MATRGYAVDPSKDSQSGKGKGPLPVRTYLADPVLGWRGIPGASFSMVRRGKEVVANLNQLGYRQMSGQPAVASREVWVFGCSFVFGLGLADDETFCALLQREHPDWRIENFGMNGYGPTHNLLQMESEMRFAAPDFAVFCFIPGHRYRAVGHYSTIQSYQWPVWEQSSIELYPKAYIDRQGNVSVTHIRFKRPDLKKFDIADFGPDEWAVDETVARVFQRAAKYCESRGVRFLAVVLRGGVDGPLFDRLRRSHIELIDASMHSGPEFSFMPEDGHPNQLANQRFAATINAVLDKS